jgi:hypothetical protein
MLGAAFSLAALLDSAKRLRNLAEFPVASQGWGDRYKKYVYSLPKDKGHRLKY